MRNSNCGLLCNTSCAIPLRRSDPPNDTTADELATLALLAALG